MTSVFDGHELKYTAMKWSTVKTDHHWPCCVLETRLVSYQRSGFIKFSPAKLTAPSQGGSPEDSKSLCGNRELQERSGGSWRNKGNTYKNMWLEIIWHRTHVIFPGPGWRDISVTSWPLVLSRRISSRPTKPVPPPTSKGREIFPQTQEPNHPSECYSQHTRRRAWKSSSMPIYKVCARIVTFVRQTPSRSYAKLHDLNCACVQNRLTKQDSERPQTNLASKN